MEDEFARLMNVAFVEWQHKLGEPKQHNEWAMYLGIDATLVSHYRNGRRKPGDPKIIAKLADKIGPCVYEALGLLRPDPLIRFVIDNWDYLDDGAKESLLLIVEENIGITRGEKRTGYALSFIDSS